MRKHIAYAILAIGALSAHAQSDAQNADSLRHTLQEVTVTSTAASKETKSAAPIRIVDQERISLAGIADVSDALHRMPGVTLRDYGGAGGLKTVSVRGFGASHTGVFYDGVPLSDMQSGQIDLSRYSIDNVANVSMVIGDNDDIFIPARAAASSATVNIATMPVIEDFLLNAKLRFGSFGYVNPFLKIGTPLSSAHTSAINFVGEFTHADNDYPFTLVNGQEVTRERRTNSRMNSGHAEINYIQELDSRNSLTAKVYYYANSRQLPGPVIYYTSVSHEHLREQNAMAQLRWRSRFGDKVSLSAIAKYNWAASLYHDENGKYPGGVLDQNYWQREYYATCALMYLPADKWMLDYSADYFYNNLNSNLLTNSRPYRHSILQSLTAKYKTSRLTVMARVLGSIYVNGAKEGSAAQNASRLSPSLCLSLKPMASQNLFVRASYKNIFRMPTFNEAYFDHYGSADVKPETTNQINLGLTYSLGAGGWLKEGSFSIDGYLNHVNDMIVAVPYNMFIWTMTNLGKVRTAGLDVTADVSISPKSRHTVTIMGSYSLQRAMPRTNREASDWMKQVAYIPKHSGSMSVSYENPWVCLSVSASGVSERFTTNANLPATRIPGYMEFGASAWRTFHIKRHTLDARIDVQNLFDKQYSIVARYPMPGRQFKFTVSFAY